MYSMFQNGVRVVSELFILMGQNESDDKINTKLII